MRRLVIFDFDGTLCLGDDPVLTYARFVDAALSLHGIQAGVHGAVQRGMDAGDLVVDEIVFDSADTPADIAGKTDMVLWPLQDGYQLVQLLGLQAGLTADVINEAFRDSRAHLLGTGLAAWDVHAPDGAAELIAQLRQNAAVVLVTNSPAEDFELWLHQLGLSDVFDLVINSAKKPAGMAAAIERARTVLAPEGEPIAVEEIVSIGDIWGNDLAHVHELGGTTILIDRFATGLGTPDVRIRSAEHAVRHLSQEHATSR